MGFHSFKQRRKGFPGRGNSRPRQRCESMPQRAVGSSGRVWSREQQNQICLRGHNGSSGGREWNCHSPAEQSGGSSQLHSPEKRGCLSGFPVVRVCMEKGRWKWDARRVGAWPRRSQLAPHPPSPGLPPSQLTRSPWDPRDLFVFLVQGGALPFVRFLLGKERNVYLCCCLDFQLLTQTLTMKAKAKGGRDKVAD